MKNLKLVMFFTACFLFAGMQYATAQVKDKVEEVKATTDEVKEGVKKEASKLNLEDDKRVYTTKTGNTDKTTKTANAVKGVKGAGVKKVDAAAKMKGTIEKPKVVNGETTIKELDSDDLEEDDLEKEDDDN